ncbi:hypothetical protein HK101_001092 [Irineochytrium annulatum]|nr:hypothetical protein HK101_001092 [Irineochytrium annulatum]
MEELYQSQDDHVLAMGAHASCILILAHELWKVNVAELADGKIGWAELAGWVTKRTQSNGHVVSVRYGGVLDEDEQVFYPRMGEGWMLKNPLVLPKLSLFEESGNSGGDATVMSVCGSKGAEKLRAEFELASSKALAALAETFKNRDLAQLSMLPHGFASHEAMQPLFGIPYELTVDILRRLPANDLLRLEQTSRSARDLIRSQAIAPAWLDRCAELNWVFQSPDGKWRTVHSSGAIDLGQVQWRSYYLSCARSESAWNCARIFQVVRSIIHAARFDGISKDEKANISALCDRAAKALAPFAAESSVRPVNEPARATTAEALWVGTMGCGAAPMRVERRAASDITPGFPQIGTEESTAILDDAIKSGDGTILECFVRAGWDPSSRLDKEGNTAAHLAARYGQPDALATLYAFGADIDAINDDGFDVWTMCCLYGRIRTLKRLIGVARPAWSTFITSRHPSGLTPLGVATVHGHLSIVSWLLSLPVATTTAADPPLANASTGETVFMVAAREADIAMLRVIMDCGAAYSAHALDGRAPAPYGNGFTALHVVVSERRFWAALLLMASSEGPAMLAAGDAQGILAVDLACSVPAAAARAVPELPAKYGSYVDREAYRHWSRGGEGQEVHRPVDFEAIEKDAVEKVEKGLLERFLRGFISEAVEDGLTIHELMERARPVIRSARYRTVYTKVLFC